LTDDGLGAMWGKEMAMQYFQEAGFGSVQVHELAHDIQYYYYVCPALKAANSSRLRPQRVRANNRN
jgi:hypothetical protein